ncbi:MAG: hypothetical protein ACJ752_04490 [Gaiellaceae bacterium]
MGLTLFSAVLASALLPSHGCRAALPRGPAVPAPIIVQTSCGWFGLKRGGRVTRLPRSPVGFGRGGAAEDGSRHYGADLVIRRTHPGRFIVLRLRRTDAGRLMRTVIWRSHDNYYNTGAESVFGPHLFAFAAYYRGMYLTDLRRRERLVLRGRGLYPIGFSGGGDLMVAGSGHPIAVVAPDGTVLRRYSYRPRMGFAWDYRTYTLYFVRPDGMLAAAHGAHLRLIRRLRGIEGEIGFTLPGLLVFNGPRSIAITSLAGKLVARDEWPRTAVDNYDSGLSVAPNGRTFVFRLSNAHPGASHGEAVVYVLRAGQSHARAIYRHRLGPSGCAVGAGMEWRGRYLLYSSADGQQAVLDTRSGRQLSLMPLLRRIPQRGRSQTYNVFWRSDFAHA